MKIDFISCLLHAFFIQLFLLLSSSFGRRKLSRPPPTWRLFLPIQCVFCLFFGFCHVLWWSFGFTLFSVYFVCCMTSLGNDIVPVNMNQIMVNLAIKVWQFNGNLFFKLFFFYIYIFVIVFIFILQVTAVLSSIAI